MMTLYDIKVHKNNNLLTNLSMFMFMHRWIDGVRLKYLNYLFC